MLVAKVKKIIFSKDDYYVLATDMGSITISTPGEIKPKQQYLFKGDWVDTNYGKTYQAEKIVQQCKTKSLISQRDLNIQKQL